MSRYTKILDFILRKLIEKKQKDDNWSALDDEFGNNPPYKIQLKKETIVKFTIKEWEFNMLIEKLINDKHVFENLNPTYEGVYMLDLGGYKSKRFSRIVAISYKIITTITLFVITALTFFFSCQDRDERKAQHESKKEEVCKLPSPAPPSKTLPAKHP